MKLLVVFACLVAAVYAQADIQVIRSSQDVQPDSYNYAYELSNGVAAQESGAFKEIDTFGAQGFYRYDGPDGQTYEVRYTADENGYRPTGDHLPSTPAPL